MDVVSSPAGVHDNGMGRGERPTSDHEDELGKSKHGDGAKTKNDVEAMRMSFSFTKQQSAKQCTT